MMKTEVSDDFSDAFTSGGSMICEECMCGRFHFCNPDISHGDFEEGEYEGLKKLAEEQPDKYIESEYGCIDYFEFGNDIVVWDCPCGNDVYYENSIWRSRSQIMNFFKNRLKTMETNFCNLSSEVSGVDFKFENDLQEKYTFEEFVNKAREYKLKNILE